MSRNRKGVTLIEVLIAVTLLSLLTVGMLWAIRIGLGSMGKANAKLMANRRITGAQRVLEQQIAGFMPVAGRMRGLDGAPGLNIPFFQGEQQSMRFVSSYSLQEGSRGTPRVVEFTVIPGDDGAGVRLIVNEWPYTGPDSAGVFVAGRAPDPNSGRYALVFAPIEAGPRSFVLADRLEYCRFSFQRWVPHWVQDIWPNAIRIEMGPLDPDNGRLRMMTLTAPIHVTRRPMEEYADE
jgi:prepilin-type N-terminal cleavage/methylation domain-containing protein